MMRQAAKQRFRGWWWWWQVARRQLKCPAGKPAATRRAAGRGWHSSRGTYGERGDWGNREKVGLSSPSPWYTARRRPPRSAAAGPSTAIEVASHSRRRVCERDAPAGGDGGGGGAFRRGREGGTEPGGGVQLYLTPPMKLRASGTMPLKSAPEKSNLTAPRHI